MVEKPKFMCVVVGYTDVIAKDPETGIYSVSDNRKHTKKEKYFFPSKEGFLFYTIFLNFIEKLSEVGGNSLKKHNFVNL